MNIQELRTEHRAKVKEARALSKKITDDTPENEALKIEREFDLLMAEADELREQIDEAKEQRTDDGDDRRPRGVDAEARGVEGCGPEARDAAFGLKPEERMTTWAQAKRPEQHNLTLGQYLGAMVRGAKTETEKRALTAVVLWAIRLNTLTLRSARSGISFWASCFGLKGQIERWSSLLALHERRSKPEVQTSPQRLCENTASSFPAWAQHQLPGPTLCNRLTRKRLIPSSNSWGATDGTGIE